MDALKRGQAPFGFRWLGGKLAIEDEEARTRRAAFDLFLKHRTLGATAKALNSAGFGTRRGGKWSDVQVSRLLECHSAIGTYEANRSAGEADGKRRATAKAERVVIECDPIVSQEVWDRVAQLLQGTSAMILSCL